MLRRVATACALAWGLLAAPAAAAALRVEVDRASGRVAVAHGPRTLLAAGVPAVRTPDGWLRATAARGVRRTADGGLRATLRTRGPGLALRARVGRTDGAVRLELFAPGATGTRVAFALRPRERLLGFGERSNAVDQRGRVVENVVAEGPYQREELPLLRPFVPAWALRPRPDASSFPIPWLLSTAGHGVLVEDDAPSRFRLGSDDPGRWSVEVDAPRLRLALLAGPRPADVVRRLVARVGRQPRVPPEAFGPWHHSEPRLGDERARIEDLQRAGVPLSVAQIFTQYLPCAAHRAQREAQRDRVRLFHARGLAATTYVNPQLCVEHPQFPEAVASGALTRTRAGAPYLYRFSVRADLVGEFAFSAPAGRRLFARLAGEAVADGHDGWMEDYGEYSPPDAPGGPAAHNAYPRRFHCAAQALAGAPLRYVRSGWTGSARCSPVVWGGDPTVGWGFDGLRSAVVNGLTMGLSGVSTWGSDIGGFFAFFERRLRPELLVRWIQLGAVSGVMRLQATGIAVPPKPRAQPWDPEVLPHWRRWTRLRTQLFPYVEAADAAYRRRGLPIMRHLALAYPRDRRAVATDDAFLFGPDLLAAPVTRPGARARRVALPPGRWIDLWRSARLRRSDGALALGRARVLAGGRAVRLPAPLAELPLLVRAGALLALLPPEVDTLSAYGDRAPAVSLGERRGERRLLAFPRGSSSARVGARDGVLRSREIRGGWELRFATPRPLRWRVQAALGALRRPLGRPCRVTLDGRALARGAWSHAPRAAVLRVALRTRTGTLRVTRC